ncbi:acyl-CoA dehydrogenase family protein [Aquisalimonas lutea]|uniref:acyl-CoA dehydrogenase family protein n=1 Tax=Aquisalimonas lutea TaxID=1327750 RepID=UPI0025B39E12|nr:acyl-CoA dehydrogenase family protein [Aquisalimonas lutea]MDN3518010.1 acyl-CoA dehydrogenase family protein [Aquisalimonas lutea]
MDFSHSSRSEAIRSQVFQFMEHYVLPYNAQWHREVAAGRYPLELVNDIKALARWDGLWNLFLPGLRDDEPGTPLSTLDYAPVAETMGRVHWAAEVFNCSAPDTGNMELLHRFATPAQYRDWLAPLLDGEIRSCFAMSEPDVASSDATGIRTSIRRDGGDYVINGRKWFITGALHPNCRLAVVLGVSDEAPDSDPHHRHSMVLVPMDAPGLEIVRDLPVMHYHAPEGHCELVFRNVRVPAANLLGDEGRGFAMAQARLGPGRIHHCMRSIGQCELALELMRERALERRSFGRYLSEQANIGDWIAWSRMEIDQARLLVLHAAWLIDQGRDSEARTAVSAIKVVVAQLQTRVVDRAMQVFGAMGLTPDTPLSYLWTWGRAMRFLDGPDEVHLRSVARSELRRARETRGATARYFTLPGGGAET